MARTTGTHLTYLPVIEYFFAVFSPRITDLPMACTDISSKRERDVLLHPVLSPPSNITDCGLEQFFRCTTFEIRQDADSKISELTTPIMLAPIMPTCCFI